MITLDCVATYRNDARGLHFREGHIYDVEDDLAAYLATDAPGCFKKHPPKRPTRSRVRDTAAKPDKEK